MDSFFSQLQSASQTCTASEVAEDKKTKFADAYELACMRWEPEWKRMAVAMEYLATALEDLVMLVAGT